MNTTVHEHRAPTDESLRILQEMEEKVTDKIITAIHIQNNIINGAAVFFVNDPSVTTIKMTVHFDLNGQRIKIDHIITDDDMQRAARNCWNDRSYMQSVLQMIMKLISDKIALHFVEQTQHDFLRILELKKR